MSATIISFVNLKGGVGKTALVVNVGVSLAAEYGRKVLIVDLDPQSNASLWLMGLRDWINRANDQFRKTAFGLICRGEPVGECLVKSPIRNEEGSIEAETLDLLPSTYHLVKLEEDYIQREGREPPYVRFYRQIKILREQYEYIVIDCPPNVYRATKCGVFASDRVIVPCNPDSLSWMGLDLVSKLIEGFGRRTEGEFTRERPGDALPLVSGVIINDVHATHTTVNEKSKDWFQKRLNYLKKGGHVRADAEVLPIRIRHAAALQRGSYSFRPILFSEPSNTNLLQDYRNIAALFLTKFGGEHG